MAETLTEGVLLALEPPRRGSRLIWDAELVGFALRLFATTKTHPESARTFLLSYWRNGTERRFRIGSWPDWSVTAARAEARELRRRIDRGEEVASDGCKRREAPTMADLSERYKPEQLQHVADVHHDDLVALTLYRAITDSDELANRTRMSLLLKPMTGDWQDQAQGNPYKGVEQNLARLFLSPVEIALVCDPQMRSVWKELSRRRRDGTFLYPARDAWWERRMFFLLPVGGAPSAADARERQDKAVVELFDTVLACKLLHLATTTRREAEQQRDHYLAKAQELERDALTMVSNPETMVSNPECFAYKRDERSRRLREAAKTYKDYAHETYTAAIRMALDRNHDGRARWVALTIANKLHELFGLPMYGLTATITSVALGRTVTPRAVRQWCHPADKARKNRR
jgi:hypothetical protein